MDNNQNNLGVTAKDGYLYCIVHVAREHLTSFQITTEMSILQILTAGNVCL